MRMIIRILGLLAVLGLLAGCGSKEVRFSGRTMGTAYHIKVVVPYFKQAAYLKKEIEQRLREINQSMSTYIPDSEISRFNNISQVDRQFCISNDFYYVLTVSTTLYQVTQGAWDGTVRPLVALWGFGDDKETQRIPAQDEIDTVLQNTGFDKIIIKDNQCIIKKNPQIALDLGSIAKGFGTDQIAEMLMKQGFDNFLVEIGGEVYASGVRQDGRAWRIGVNTPLKEAAYNQVYKMVKLKNKSLATSGDYRNFFEKGGQRYSHVLDPRTGYPVQNGVISVSVMADDCTFADGLATALMVMGADEGLALVKRLDDVECMIVAQSEDGNLNDYYSPGFSVENEM
ncbi:FAD:protein FMN transferase [Desulfococcaceae bacterium HSG9]|nr:FAD:protein FMN transferase [Desulfococcaceae bacterium HSG9]